jgi:hypothetical protein
VLFETSNSGRVLLDNLLFAEHIVDSHFTGLVDSHRSKWIESEKVLWSSRDLPQLRVGGDHLRVYVDLRGPLEFVVILTQRLLNAEVF